MNKITTNEYSRLLLILKDIRCIYCNGEGYFQHLDISPLKRTCIRCKETGITTRITNEDIFTLLTSIK